ncbi:hypothetical protein CYMTET_11791 [Cymbomonas tetramitiformis]|uniref:Uncharacterized protein n=1 Tax=Cymbomonas tetramitiformis TaxID=36881 RepID=A0AAE0GLS2_9CHLO|nr:hypothetical protein CYMTET_11791 [Cymbomonas tetramitiformis]
MVLTAPKRNEAVDRRASPWDMDVVKRVFKSSMGDKTSTFSGNEPRRLELWDSIYESFKYAFTQVTDDNSSTLLDLVDTSAERALLEVTKRLLPREEEPLGHVSNLVDINFPADVDPEPLIFDYYTALAKAPAALGIALPPRNAKRKLLAALDRDFYKDVRNPLVKDVEIDKVDLEDIFTHVMQMA